MNHTRMATVLGGTALLFGGCSILGEQSVPAEDLEEGVADLLEEQVGEPVASVDCDDDLAAEVGSEVRCILEADDGSTIGLTITAESIDGGDVNYQVEVDEEPITDEPSSPSAEPSSTDG
ncbi:DUF4333 domain-containing protein [Haloactinopolyspora sp.]|uniref:DUF4333 domain-containing protein n=1 Tax=Haloactinopolyspora sp. TaxID=1966353 RepID=UPI00260DA396|nr:DUF4333 domain-containing protein [Haloactinopolyspora sp.]